MRKTRKIRKQHFRRMRGGNSEIPKKIIATTRIVPTPQVANISRSSIANINNVTPVTSYQSLAKVKTTAANIRNTSKNIGILDITPIKNINTAKTHPTAITHLPTLICSFVVA